MLADADIYNKEEATTHNMEKMLSLLEAGLQVLLLLFMGSEHFVRFPGLVGLRS
jgi:hypothetical protein